MKTENLILIIINRWVGVESGYLGLPEKNRFTFKSHKEFYPEYCDFVKNPDFIEGTTRERFIKIFQDSTPKEQAKIIRGIIERFPFGEGPKTRTRELQTSLLK